MLKGFVYLDVRPPHGLAGCHGNLQPDASGKTDRQQPEWHRTFGRHELPPDGVPALAVQDFTCRKITLGNGYYVRHEL